MSRRRRASPFSLFAFQDIITATTGIVILLTLLLTLELLMRGSASAQLVSAQLVRQAEEALAALAEQADQLRQRVAAGQENVSELVAADAQDIDRKIRDLQNQIALAQREVQSLTETATDRRKLEEDVLAQKFDRQEDQQRAAQLAEEIRRIEAEIARMQRDNTLYFNPSPESGLLPWLVEVAGGQVDAARAGQHQQAEHTFQGSDAAEQFISFARTRSSTGEYFVLLVRPSGAAELDVIREKLDDEGFRYGIDLIGEQQVVIGAAPVGAAP